MCIIIGEPDCVSNTKILVSMIRDSSQLVVYSNIVGTKKPVVMIIPFPNREVKPFIISTDQNDSNIFKDLDDCFTRYQRHVSKSIPLSVHKSDVLDIFRSDNWQYSIANNLSDLNNINKDVFQVDKGDLVMLSEYDAKNYGFIVCIINKHVTYSPFAYICATDNGKLFIPTKQYCSGNKNIFPFTRWDHNIYVLNHTEPTRKQYLDPNINVYMYPLRNKFYNEFKKSDIDFNCKNYSFSKYLSLEKFNENMLKYDKSLVSCVGYCLAHKILKLKRVGRCLNEDILI